MSSFPLGTDVYVLSKNSEHAAKIVGPVTGPTTNPATGQATSLQTIRVKWTVRGGEDDVDIERVTRMWDEFGGRPKRNRGGTSPSTSTTATTGPEPAPPTPGGEGGVPCTAWALVSLKVFRTVQAAIEALDMYGEKLFEKRKEEEGSDYPVEDVYWKGTAWDAEVIKTTVIEQGFDFEKLKIERSDPDHVKLSDTLKKGNFLLDGILNMGWNSPRHAIAVVDGIIRENPTNLNLDRLWIGVDGVTPDREKGYFREICRAYQITRR
eukprot:CAMPEP_0182503034 /NCGR_PEP_ID=MMETSP1321-20130603/14542_1 /TAXON_ID=91990 /ORGANISM="Bolidomonas sp., Strain RCC1657" /LENGTH=264 /DNA_ID=CAMNT_0024708107 /DNA_START=61 /DNA_END=852 /DNA_ORIENTATION=-